jgi:hypothetical protein
MLLLAVVLSACGSSSSSGSTGKTSTSAAAKPGSNRFATLRSCLSKDGITLPERTGGSGQPSTTGGPPSGGGFKLPAGVSQTKLREALKKCGGGFGGGRPGFNSTASRKVLARYSACMRENGVDLPAPNTSHKGPIFNTKGLNTTSASFKAAEKKCQSDLKGAFGQGSPGAAGGTPPAGAGGAPPTGGNGSPPGGEPAGA